MSQTNFTQICSICGEEIISWSLVPICDKCKKYLHKKSTQRKRIRHLKEEDPNGPKTTD
jgi:hypothetical protein